MLLATLGVAGLVAATAVLVARAGGGQGPLVTHGPGGGQSFTQPVHVGQTISVSGPLVLENTSDQPLVIDRVRLVGIPGGMYRGAYVLLWHHGYTWPRSEGTPFSAAPSYHVPRDGRAIPGARVAPHAWIWIVIGLAAKRGLHQFTQADITYRYRGGTYQRHAKLLGAVCTPSFCGSR